MGSSVIRLSRFRPLWPGFDVSLRESVIPDLAGRAGLLTVFAGRAGFDKDGPRLLASVWLSEVAMASALGPDITSPTFHPELMEAVGDREVQVRSLVVSHPPREVPDAGILRLVWGRARPGQLADYVDEVRDGTEADVAAGFGPLALYLGVERPNEFSTLSLWDSWSHLQASTGADYQSVDRTRHADLLEAWSADHYELVPGTIVLAGESTERQPVQHGLEPLS